MKKTITYIASFVSMIAMIAIAPLASANYAINSASGDCKTVTIGNYTTGEGINGACWTNSAVSAAVGQTINVAIYYNNSGNTPANNVVFKLTDPQGTTVSANGSVSFTGKILVDGTEVKSEIVTVNISGGPSHLILGNVMRYDRPSHSNVPMNNGNSILSSSGLSYGALQPGWDNQGVIKVSFSIIGDTNNQGQKPGVETSGFTHRNHELGQVRLNGIFSSNGSTTTTWFEYRKVGQSSWTTTTTQIQGSTASGNIYKDLSDLSTGSYEYRAVAENQYGRVNGALVAFSINRGGDCPSCGGCSGVDCNPCDDNPNLCCDSCECVDECGDELEVETKSAEDIDTDSALLVGDINDIGSGNVERWFEWDTNKSDVSNDDGKRLSLSGDTDSEGEFTKRLSGLDADTTYYFRACAEDDNGDRDCGAVKSFTADDNGDNNNDRDLPDITTLSAIAVGSTVATVDGFYDANGCSVTTYFEYGRTNSLGSKTASVNRGNGSGSMMYSFTSLAANTTYYYRAVGSNCEGTVRGSIRNFTTNNTTVVNPPIVITGGSGNAFIKLMIDNHRDTVRAGSEIAYDVSWENITTRRLNDLILEVTFPDQMIVIDTDQGTISRGGHSVIVEINELTSREKDDMTIVAEVRSGLRDGDPVVAQAIMAFENPTTQATENAIAYDSDEFSARTTGLGASLFGLDFLPGSLVGWLLLLLIILIIIVLARQFMGSNRNNGTVAMVANPAPTPNPANNGNDYIVYRPNPNNR